MDKALTSEYKIITADKAAKRQIYFCPCCKEELIFASGQVYTPYFRHRQSAQDEMRCELYSEGVQFTNLNELEIEAMQQIRLEIDVTQNGFQFFLHFPLIKQKFERIVDKDHLYFNIHCKEENKWLNSIMLLPSRQQNHLAVDLKERYTITVDNGKIEKLLELKIAGVFTPLLNDTIIFKQINGSFSQVLYPTLTLIDRFFILSKKPLIIHKRINVLNEACIENMYLYECLMPIEFSEDLQNWFLRILKYKLLPSKYHLDLMSPVSFNRRQGVFEVTAKSVELLLSHIDSKPLKSLAVIFTTNEQRRVVEVPESGILSVSLKKEEIYTVYMLNEIGEMITVKRVNTLTQETSYMPQLSINQDSVVFKKKLVYTDKESIISSDTSFVVYPPDNKPYKLDQIKHLQIPQNTTLHIPYIWSVHVTESKMEIKDDSLFNKLLYLYKLKGKYPMNFLSLQQYKLLKSIIVESNFREKEKLLFYIDANRNRVSKPIIEVLNSLGDMQ